MRIALIRSIFALVTIGVALALPDVFLPKRWLEIRPGQDRTIVHTVLGVPDIDFTEMKRFDGWHNSFGIGASVIVVRYDDIGTKVSSVKISTDWGRGHLEWVQQYKAQLAVASN